MGKVLARLTRDELDEVRRSYALTEVARSGRTDMPIEAAVEAIVTDYELCERLREDHGIDFDDDTQVDLVRGAIVEVYE